MVAMGLNKGLPFKPFVLAPFGSLGQKVGGLVCNGHCFGSLGHSSGVKSFLFWARFVLAKPKALLRGLSRRPMLVGFSKSSFLTLAT